MMGFTLQEEMDLQKLLGNPCARHKTIEGLGERKAWSVTELVKDYKWVGKKTMGAYLMSIGTLLHAGLEVGIRRTNPKAGLEMILKDDWDGVTVYGTCDLVHVRDKEGLVIDHKTTAYFEKYLQLITATPASYVFQVNAYRHMCQRTVWKDLEIKAKGVIHAVYSGPTPSEKELNRLAIALAYRHGVTEILENDSIAFPYRVAIEIQDVDFQVLADFAKYRDQGGLIQPFSSTDTWEKAIEAWTAFRSPTETTTTTTEETL